MIYFTIENEGDFQLRFYIVCMPIFRHGIGIM